VSDDVVLMFGDEEEVGENSVGRVCAHGRHEADTRKPDAGEPGVRSFCAPYRQ
jgi:hypothetical protein